MKITIGESKKKKNLKKLKREALEVHRVPDDLDNDCDGAYGDGYEAGREYASEEQELDEEFATEDDYNVDPDATIPTLEEQGRNIIPTMADSPASKSAKAKSRELAAQIRNDHGRSMKRDAVVKQRAKNVQQLKDVGAPKNIQQLSQNIKNVDMRNLSRQGGKAWEQFPWHPSHGQTGHRPGSEKWRELLPKNAPVEEPPKPKVKARPKKPSLKLPTNPVAGKGGVPIDPKRMPLERSGIHSAQALADQLAKRNGVFRTLYRKHGTKALRLTKQVLKRILGPVAAAAYIADMADLGYRIARKANVPLAPPDADDSAWDWWSRFVDLGYGDERKGGAFDALMGQEQDWRPNAGYEGAEKVSKKEIKEMKIKVGKKKILKEGFPKSWAPGPPSDDPSVGERLKDVHGALQRNKRINQKNREWWKSKKDRLGVWLAGRAEENKKRNDEYSQWQQKKLKQAWDIWSSLVDLEIEPGEWGDAEDRGHKKRGDLGKTIAGIGAIERIKKEVEKRDEQAKFDARVKALKKTSLGLPPGPRPHPTQRRVHEGDESIEKGDATLKIKVGNKKLLTEEEKEESVNFNNRALAADMDRDKEVIDCEGYIDYGGMTSKAKRMRAVCREQGVSDEKLEQSRELRRKKVGWEQEAKEFAWGGHRPENEDGFERYPMKYRDAVGKLRAFPQWPEGSLSFIRGSSKIADDDPYWDQLDAWRQEWLDTFPRSRWEQEQDYKKRVEKELAASKKFNLEKKHWLKLLTKRAQELKGQTGVKGQTLKERKVSKKEIKEMKTKVRKKELLTEEERNWKDALAKMGREIKQWNMHNFTTSDYARRPSAQRFKGPRKTDHDIGLEWIKHARRKQLDAEGKSDWPLETEDEKFWQLAQYGGIPALIRNYHRGPKDQEWMEEWFGGEDEEGGLNLYTQQSAMKDPDTMQSRAGANWVGDERFGDDAYEVGKTFEKPRAGEEERKRKAENSINTRNARWTLKKMNLHGGFTDKQKAEGQALARAHDEYITLEDIESIFWHFGKEMNKSLKESQNFHDKWRSFLKEEDSGEGTPASRLGDDLLKNLDQLEASTIDPEGGMPWIGADEVGEFIVDQGGEEQALAYIESMRQEIIGLMAEEDEELKFTEDHPEYDTSKMGEEEVEVEEDL
jgi:hypothetical protein